AGRSTSGQLLKLQISCHAGAGMVDATSISSELFVRSTIPALQLLADLTERRGVTVRMPTLYLSHGAPPLADDPVWPGELAAWSAGVERPAAILVVSAHWEGGPARA